MHDEDASLLSERRRRKKKEEDLSLFFPEREFYAGKNVRASALSVFNLNLFFSSKRPRSDREKEK
jgi:hypothetical protein